MFIGKERNRETDLNKKHDLGQKKKVLVINTGGTIGMQISEHGLMPASKEFL